MKKILMAILIQSCLLANSYKLNLLQYADLVSQSQNVKILISDEININSFYFFTKEKEPKISLNLFKKMIDLKDLRLEKKYNFYFISKKDEDLRLEKSDYVYSLDLKNNSSEDVRNVLAVFDINSTYTNSNKVYFATTKEKYTAIHEQILKADKPLEQVKLKFTIIETDLTKMKDRAVDIKAFLKNANSSLTYSMNLLTMPYMQSSNIIKFEAPRFYSVINFLDGNKISEVKSSPFLSVKSNKSVYFSVVKNIPYLTQTKSINENKQTQENSYTYKDVGLKVNLKPLILDDGVDFELHLIIEDLLNEGVTPIISKKELKSSYFIKFGEILVLSGLNKNLTFKDDYSIPILSKLWILGNLFKFSVEKQSNTIVSMIIEVIK